MLVSSRVNLTSCFNVESAPIVPAVGPSPTDVAELFPPGKLDTFAIEDIAITVDFYLEVVHTMQAVRRSPTTVAESPSQGLLDILASEVENGNYCTKSCIWQYSLGLLSENQ